MKNTEAKIYILQVFLYIGLKKKYLYKHNLIFVGVKK